MDSGGSKATGRDIIAPMKVVCAALIAALVLYGAEDKHAPLPDRVVTAKTVFLQNDSGEQNLTDQVYREIERWGRWKVVTDRADADIVISVDRKPLDSKDRFRNNFYLHVLDGKTGEDLLTLKRNKVLGRTGDVAKELVSDLKNRLPPASTHL
jgi:hypothetical protein